MRRLAITITAACMLLAFPVASALARHESHARHHHARHHATRHHARRARTRRFGPRSVTSSADAGHVQKFQNGMLTILLGDNTTTITGRITSGTELECMAAAPGQMTADEQGSPSDDQSGDGDHSGSGDSTANSDDNNATDNDANEDQGNDANEANDNDANEDQGNDANDDDMASNCSTANLTPGTVVHEAELRISGTSSTWKKVELGS